MIYKNLGKPVGDFLIALIALLILIPIFILVAIAIKLESKGPVFFLQKRLGRNGSEFIIFKFRSMRTDLNIEVSGVYENDPRITKVGRFIRKTSIDELPQIINILLGDMSFIGPRPPLSHYPKVYDEYSEFEKKRFFVKPGISGLAQVRCREVHDWGINIPIDVEYVENFGFKTDFKLFLSSVFMFFKTDNIYSKS
ncbi:sugar transferase [Lunatibacter salilacus]|uniref:sugar transferase n=1 Tax=Lunatibacter salilacus TaxID=2483804 RepID=UPI0018FE7F33|nr:sugar transferase [Lunatibacter salilacus]